MLFNSNDFEKNKEILLSNLQSWLGKTSDNKKIYIIVQNPYQKQNINDFLDENKIFNKNLIVTTFLGLVYNCIIENKEHLPKEIDNLNLTGLDASQYILKNIIKQIGFKDYKSQINILHQLFRRYSLIVQNDLTQEEVRQRSKIAGETYIDECENAVNLYKQTSNKLGIFDYLRQLSIFRYLMKNADILNNAGFLCVFGCEEFSHIFYEFLEYISQKTDENLIFYDENGATRIGFLCAPLNCEQKLKKIFKTDTKNIKKNCKFALEADKITEKKFVSLFKNNCFLYRNEMINNVQKEILNLLAKGESPDEIAVITPCIDETLKFLFDSDKFYYLSGNTKLIDDFAIKNIIFLNDLIDDKIDFTHQNFELRKFLSTFFDFCENKHKNLSDFVKNDNKIAEIAINVSKFTILSQKIIFLYKKLAEMFSFSSENEKNVKFLIKQITDFEKIFFEKKEDKLFQTEIIEQLKISVVSENSSEFEKIPEDKIIVATEQKFIDCVAERKYVFMLDFTSSQWNKNDIGPMYNSWVMQKDYDRKIFEIADNIELSTLKLKRILRKILLNTKNEIKIFSSVYDSYGQENFSDMLQFLTDEQEKKITEKKEFKLRPEQEEIKNYKNGCLAISAVPGAGKTTVILEIVKKLIETGENAENIFVLTYMDSAAKNFKERLINLLPRNSKLPNISTIHGLALRIIKENSNFARLNLDEDFEIADETKRSKLFVQAFFANKCKEELYSNFERGISVMKFNQKPKITGIKDITLKKFIDVYKIYCNLLKENNLIDYDDMLILAIKLLEGNPDILKYYQNICKFVIEDEAQDSSSLQQELLTLLSGKYKNFIRCGDANQAITQTFTNADTEGFRKFIQNNTSKKMTVSQRCAPTIAGFANKLNTTFPKAFLQIQITNPEQNHTKEENAVKYQQFEQETNEIIDIANSIKAIFSKNKNSQIAILVRNNYQVEKYESILHENGIKTVVREGLLGQQKVFAIVFAILKILNNPACQKTLEENYKILCNYEFYDIEDKISESSQFYWDLKYFQKFNFKNYANLVTKIGYFYFKNEIDRSNTEILSFLTKRICSEKATFEELLQEFEKLSKKPPAAFFKFFENVSDAKNDFGKVQIMTIHKSKGNEFDYVFLPEFSNENFPVSALNYKIKSEDIFLESIKSLGENYILKNRTQLQELVANETLRLIYVAITRAKKQLYISFSKNITKFSKKKSATELTAVTSLI